MVLGSAIAVAAMVVGVLVGVWLAGGEEQSSSGAEPSVSSEESSTGAPADPTSPNQEESSGVAQAERSEILQFAARATEAMFARDFDSYDKSVANAVELMTDSFATEYRATAADVRSDFVDSRTSVEVKIVGTGAISIDGDAADVLVFSNQYVERGGDPTYTPYRLVLTLTHDGNGWLVDGVATDDPDPRPEPDPEQAAILDAARRMTMAFLNLDHRTMADDVDEVLALATGKFAREYEDSAQQLQELMATANVVQRGEIFAAGITHSDAASATVIVATQGTVRNNQTGNEPAERTHRLELGLELVDGEWLTADLQYVQ